MNNDRLRNDPHIIISGGPPGIANALKRRMIERGVPANEVKVSADAAGKAEAPDWEAAQQHAMALLGGLQEVADRAGWEPEPEMPAASGAGLTVRADQVARQVEVELEIARRVAVYEASARRLVNLTYDQAEAQYHDGRLNQLEFEAYQTAWRRGGHHLGAGTAAGAERPQEPEVERLVQAILSCLSDREGEGSGSTPPPPPAAPPLARPRRLPEVADPPEPEVVIAISAGSSPIPPEVLFPKRPRAPRRRMDGPCR